MGRTRGVMLLIDEAILRMTLRVRWGCVGLLLLMLRVIWLRLSGCCRCHDDDCWCFCLLVSLYGGCAVHDVWVVDVGRRKDWVYMQQPCVIMRRSCGLEALMRSTVPHTLSGFAVFSRQLTCVRCKEKRPRVLIVRRMVRWYAGWWGELQDGH